MPKNADDPKVYEFTGAPGESLTRIPGHDLRQSDVDAFDDDQKATLKNHLDADHLTSHVFKAVGPAAEPARNTPAPSKDRAADQKKGDG